jgi:hypothetical protein
MEPLIVYPDGHPSSATSHWFYDNTIELRFDKPSWSYFRVMSDGSLVKQNGVTNVVHIIDKSQALMGWAVRKALERVKKLLIDGGFVAKHAYVGGGAIGELFETTLDEIIASAKKADKEELDAAAETGHIAHDWIEQYIKALLSGADDRRLELLAKLPLDERAANACIAAGEWMSDHNVRWIATERRAFSLEHGYAGTMDGLALVDSCGNSACCPHTFKDRFTLVDWKTSNYLYLEYLLQTAAYQHAHQEETGQHIEDRWIIRLGKEDAEFDPWHMEGDELFAQDFRAFLNALALYRSVDSLKDRLSSVQSAKTAHKRAIAKAVRDAENLIACPVSAKYKGARRKKGCNDTEVMCQACTTKFKDNGGKSDRTGTDSRDDRADAWADDGGNQSGQSEDSAN